MPWDVAGHRHTLAQWHAQLLGRHKHLRGLWKNENKKASISTTSLGSHQADYTPELSQRNNSGTERTKNMQHEGGAALCYLVGGSADIFSVICPDNGRYGQLAPVWVKMMTRRVKRGRPGWRRHRCTASKLCFQTILSLPSCFAHTISWEISEEMETMMITTHQQGWWGKFSACGWHTDKICQYISKA